MKPEPELPKREAEADIKRDCNATHDVLNPVNKYRKGRNKGRRE